MQNKSVLIKLNDVYRNFQVGEVDVPVLRGIDLEIQAGEFLLIRGESGSGKSTLLNIIGGIDRPTSGSVHFKDADITRLDEKRLTLFRREKIGFVFQFYNLISTLSARENVDTAAEIADNPMDSVEALELVGLGDRLNHFPSQLSGGQQQRVAVARALVKRPEILLCDEPTGALDHENTVKILELLQRVNQKTGTTVVMITHAAAMTSLAHRTALIGDGVIQRVTTNSNPKNAFEIDW
jgi:putative ABC transport system ATP-binding protein